MGVNVENAQFPCGLSYMCLFQKRVPKGPESFKFTWGTV